jgi:hypothetical protein
MEERSEEEIVELVADALCAQGVRASAQDTGGGICCVVLERRAGGEIVWGTADVNWAASVIDAEGQPVSAIQTTLSSSSQDIRAIAEAIKDASLAADAIL